MSQEGRLHGLKTEDDDQNNFFLCIYLEFPKYPARIHCQKEIDKAGKH